MDEYIKQCDCPEIQGDKINSWHNPSEGDKWFNIPTKTISVGASEFKYRYNPNFIWLPRQEDLQEMGGFDPQYDLGRLKNLWEEYPHPMPILTLRWYMKKKHNKIWSDGWETLIVGLIDNPDMEEGKWK